MNMNPGGKTNTANYIKVRSVCLSRTPSENTEKIKTLTVSGGMSKGYRIPLERALGG